MKQIVVIFHPEVAITKILVITIGILVITIGIATG